MTDRVVILDPARPLRFLDDTCRALAEALEEMPRLDPGFEELAAVYAETVGAYAQLLHEELRHVPETSAVWLDIVAHLLQRLREVRARESGLHILHVAEQLHGRLQDATTPLL